MLALAPVVGGTASREESSTQRMSVESVAPIWRTVRCGVFASGVYVGGKMGKCLVGEKRFFVFDRLSESQSGVFLSRSREGGGARDSWSRFVVEIRGRCTWDRCR